MSGRPHVIGLTAAVLGTVSVMLLPFATFRASRIQTGSVLSTFEAVGPWGLAALLGVWLAVASVSTGRTPPASAAVLRGALATVALLGTVALSAYAVERAAEPALPFARVSLGIGAWSTIGIAYAVILSSRRETDVGRWARLALSAVPPLGVAVMLWTGMLDGLAIMLEYANQADRFWVEVIAQLTFAGIAVGVALVLGVTLGVLAFRRPRLRGPVFAVANVFQTIPGLAMVGLLFAPLSWLGSNVPVFERMGVGGLGWAPVIVALTLYALLAIVRNTYAGLASVPPEAVDAGIGMGMTEWQVLRRVRFPLAMPVIFGGARTAAVQTLGNATLGAFVAAGTLGLFVFGGLSQQAPDLILLGSVTLVVLALGLDGVLAAAQVLISPRHRRGREGATP
ncbi:MAG: ABC transporter permease [Coriobacteriia bacterium]|nr:ABC transporter permease [Coriobacteriia bacterium]MBN2841299.1 ABC transporter permease [Coriobacteriia bacterium]